MTDERQVDDLDAALRAFGTAVADGLRLPQIVHWLDRQRWVHWVGSRLPDLPWPWWRVWIWCGYAYMAVVAVAFVVAYARGWRP